MELETSKIVSIKFLRLSRPIIQNENLLLTSQFGKAYVGETMEALLCFMNRSEEFNLQKLNIQTSYQQVQKKKTAIMDQHTIDELKCGNFASFKIGIQIEETDTFTIIVESQFFLKERMDLGAITFNKRFRFETQLPIVVHTKIQSEDNNYFVQSKLTNAAINMLFVEKVDVIPSQNMVANCVGNPALLNHFNLRPGDTTSYLFKISGPSDELGKISIQWRSNNGFPGKILTIPMHLDTFKKAKDDYPIKLVFLEKPKSLVCEDVVLLTLRVINQTQMQIKDLKIILKEQDMTGLLLTLLGGESTNQRTIPVFDEYCDILFSCFPRYGGVQKLCGIIVSIQQKEFTFPNLGEIFVTM